MIDLFIKGIFIGIAKIIPGFSGAVLAISFGIYEKAIYKISNFFKNVKDNVYYLTVLLLGIVLGIIFGAFIIKYLYTNMFYFTIFIFIGLIVGVTYKFDFKINTNRKKILLIIIAIILSFFINKSVSNVNEFVYQNTLFSKLYTILIGFIDAFSTIVPGVSGTAIFISMGCYKFVLSMFSTSIFSTSAIIYFAIGILGGLIIVSIIMNYLFNNHKNITYNCIYVLCISSIFMMFTKVDYSSMNLFLFIVSVFSFIFGLYISKKIL